MAQRKERNLGNSNLSGDNALFWEKYQNLIMGVVIAIIVIIGIYMAYKYLYKAPMEKEAAASLFQAQVQFERDSFALALTNPGGGYIGFLDIIDEYGGTKAGNLAQYYAGISYLHLGKYKAAIEYLEDFSPSGTITPIMKQGALGDAYSEIEQYEKALNHYENAVSYGNEYLAPYYLLKKGLLELNLDKKEASLQTFQKLKKKYPLSSFASNVEKYITMVK